MGMKGKSPQLDFRLINNVLVLILGGGFIESHGIILLGNLTLCLYLFVCIKY